MADRRTGQEMLVNNSSLGVVLMSAGAVATVAGALMYVLPGPGLPVLMLGLALMVGGAAVRITGGR
ncbi:hypothetical protein ACTWJ9_20425 [Streptomyces sp. GDS52]|uniref:Integral membrane protein n=1 Tax=Streptomyces cathayae TaxID=3031124 RepID=A0ABY8K6Z2_9ACTN|nr:hypothetical protein [Streptomyces sp. HUAS 5]WGD42626.1 hypothetical protein PYS65_22160 [Streptomyces sp. HUAS 5]